jgi:hypothetical protein
VKILFYGIPFVVIFILSIQTAFSEDMVKYEYQNMGIRLLYPPYWDGPSQLLDEQRCLESRGCTAYLSMSKNYSQSIPVLMINAISESSDFLQLEKECNCHTLMDFVRHKYKTTQLSEFLHGFAFINDNQTTVGKKNPAWQFEYSRINEDFPDEKITSLEVMTKVNGTFYDISYVPGNNQSYASQLPDVKKVIGSMEFFPVQNPVTKTPSFLITNDTEVINSQR